MRRPLLAALPVLSITLAAAALASACAKDEGDGADTSTSGDGDGDGDGTGDGDGDGDGGGDGDGDGDGDGGGDGDGDGDGDGAGDGDGDGDGDVPPTCVTACETAADCDMGVAPYDADNYTCDDGACVYHGCNSDDECQAMGGYLCRDAGAGVDYCMPTCAEPIDCAADTPPYDEDNYLCDDGTCAYQGCNSVEECEAMGDWTCASFEGSVDVCVPTCETAADCGYGQPANDEDNYECDAGLCVYTGCNSDEECELASPGTVCH